MSKQYVKQWRVESNSTKGKFYKVSLTDQGEYECSCPAWIFRRKQCSHIAHAKANPDVAEIIQEMKPVIIPAKVRQVMKDDNRLLTPLIPLERPNGHFTATICYDLIKHGISWSELRERYYWLKSNSKQDIIDYIKAKGRCIETEESLNSGIWGYFKTEITFEGVI